MNTEYIKILPELKAHYANGGNVMEFLRNHFGRDKNTFDDIIVSYDFQSGSYIKDAEQNQQFFHYYSSDICSVLNSLGEKEYSILEAGVGEATTLANVLSKLEGNIIQSYGIDISWSRVYLGNKYLSVKNLSHAKLGVANFFGLPFKDNSMDIVYTSHALEPNGGSAEILVRELYRVAAKYLVLFEPAYDFAPIEGKQRMEKNGYVVELWDVIKQGGYHVIEHRLMDVIGNPLNPTGVTVIKKTSNTEHNTAEWACPVSLLSLRQQDSVMTNDSLGVSYPIIKNIPCLLPENAILTSCFNK